MMLAIASRTPAPPPPLPPAHRADHAVNLLAGFAGQSNRIGGGAEALGGAGGRRRARRQPWRGGDGGSAASGGKRRWGSLPLPTMPVAANDKGLSFAGTAAPAPEEASSLRKPVSLDGTAHHHVWPPLNAGWRTVLGSFIGFFGAALGSIGGVGGGGIFVPMLTLIVGFDTKSATAMSKCMITGAAVSTVYCNLKLKHPTLNMPMIDYDLALLIQPMLMMGVSIGVICNVIFPDWLVTVLFIILSLVTSTKAFLKGVETWKKETLMKREAAVKKSKQSSDEIVYTPPTGSDAIAEPRAPSDEAVSIWKNIYWKEFGLLIFVWVAILTLQVAMNYTATCSTMYWVFSLLQIPVSAGVSVYQAVSSATATFAMMFSSSIAVVEYYLLNRFPIPYALVFTCVAFIAAIVGQRVARKVINWLGRASLIIFILSFMIFIGLIPLGGFGILNINHKMAQHEYMGFHSICKSDT
ncbi:hypothetical protein ZWY2020_026195 [Hordeum vulgare]|nr:hypothetical protein ZWY2020_026195 [Hordeum vulgare]